jgi:hypothetical protein
MAETPEYQRTTPIKPQQAVQGFSEATSQFGAFASNIAKVGAGIAQESANKYAQLKGIEAAEDSRKTGKFNVASQFSLTEADKYFSQAYQTELTQSLAFDGGKTLNKLQATAAQSPTASALEDYEKIGKQTIEDLVSKAPPAARPALKRHLEDTYLSGFNQLSNKVEDANNKYLRSQQVVQADQKFKNISDRGLEGYYEAAKEALNDSLEDTATQEQRYLASGGKLGYTPEQAKAARELAQDRFRTAVMSHKWEQAHNEGRGEQFIEDLRKNPPDGLPPSERDRMVQGVQQYRQSYLSALKGQQTINYTNALTAVDSGKMTEAAMLQAQRDLSESDYAKLEHYIAKKQAKAGVLDAQVAAFIDNKDNSVALAGTSGKVANAAYQKLLQQQSEQTGEPPTLEQGAQIARGIKAKVPLFNEQLGAAIGSDNPNVSIPAAQMYRSLAKTNPVSVSGVDKKAADMAQQITSAIRRGVPSNEAHATAYRNSQVVDQDTRLKREDKLKAELKDRTPWRNETNQEKTIANLMGFQRERMPVGVQVDFMDELTRTYSNSPDMKFEDAVDIAKATIARTYGPYQGNGYNETMYLPPTLAYGGVSDIFVQNCLIENLHALGQALKGKEELPSRYEVDDSYIIPQREGFDINSFSRLADRKLKEFSFKRGGAPGKVLGVDKETSGFLKTESSAKSYYAQGNDYVGAIPGKRIDRDGTEVKGVFMIRQDEYTDSIPPSYSVMFLPDGKRIPDPVYSPNNDYSQTRFSITEDQMRRGAYERKSKEKAIEAKNKPWIQRQADIEALREQAGETDLDLI